MLMRNHNNHTATGTRRRIGTVAVIGIALLAGIGGAVAAASKPAIQLAGTGTDQPVDGGTVTVRGTATGRPVNGPYTGTLTANDGSLPEPGECESATATLRVNGTKRRFVELAAHGDSHIFAIDT